MLGIGKVFVVVLIGYFLEFGLMNNKEVVVLVGVVFMSKESGWYKGK